MNKFLLPLKALRFKLLLPSPIKKQSADIYSDFAGACALRSRMSFEMPRGLYTHSVLKTMSQFRLSQGS
jgi:hypothetical protein